MQSDNAEILPDLGTTNDVIHIVVADFNADDTFITLGNQTDDPGIKMYRKSVTGKSYFRDTTPTTDTLLSTAIDANSQAVALYTVRATPRLFLVETDGSLVSSPQDIILTATAGLDFNEGVNAIQLGTNTKLYGMATFTFAPATMPPQNEILAAVSWMNYQWRNGNKVLPPWWKNKT